MAIDNDFSETTDLRKVCFITGGSSGIGLATAKRFASQNFRIAICGRDPERLELARQQIEAAGQTRDSTLCLECDLAEGSQCQTLVSQVVEHFGQLDVLVNNAAMAPLSPLEDVTDEQFESLTNVNIRSVFYLTRAAWKIMKARNSGCIVNLSSMAAVEPFPGFSVYGASKAWVELWTQALGTEGEDHGIRVYSVRPGAVETPLLRGLFPDFPAEQCVQPEDIAEQIWKCVDSPDTCQSGTTFEIARN